MSRFSLESKRRSVSFYQHGERERELEALLRRQKGLVSAARSAVESSEKKQKSLFRGDVFAQRAVNADLPGERAYLEETERELERLERQLADVRAEMQPARDELRSV